MLLQHRLDEINSIINGYQAQIEQLQNQISQLQSHAQKVGSVEAAMESAVHQLQTAINLVNSVCPDELNRFREVVVSQFEVSTCPPQLQPVESEAKSTDAETNPPASTIPVEETSIVDDTIQPVAEADVNEEPYIDSETTDANPILNQMQLKAVAAVQGKGKAFLRAMAVKHRISHNSRTTNDQLIEQLTGKVSRADVTEYNAKE